MSARRLVPWAGWLLPVAALACLPAFDLPAFYVAFLYITCFWVAMATSWTILSGFAGYWSFGHAAFYGVGVYTSATLAAKMGVPFLLTLPVAAGMAALLGAAIGFVVFRVQRLRGELFALITISVTFVIATIVSNTEIDGGSGVYLLSVRLPEVFGSQTATIYLLGLFMAALSVWTAWRISRSRLGMGLLAIHDDEDVAEVKGVPTFRYKVIAFAISSGIAGAVGGIHSIYVNYVTVAETFEITAIMYPVVMSIFGGARHWFGPALGASIITAALYGFATGQDAWMGRAGVALGLILVILLMPNGIMPTLIRWWNARFRRDRRPFAEGVAATAAPGPAAAVVPVRGADGPILECRDVWRSFGGVQALAGVDLEIRRGEILGLVGPNGSGKSTLINAISGHYPLDRGSIRLDGAPIEHLPAHRIAALGIARTYQIPRPFNQITVIDNAALAAMFGPRSCDRAAAGADARHWLDFTGLAAKAADYPPQINLHERKFLELSRALAARPSVLLLDEVLSGLNHAEIDAALALVQRIRAGGTTIVFVEHLMRAVVALSDRIAVLNEGRLIAVGTPQETMRDANVVSVYLGKAHAS